jgi:tRNA (guanine-N7-)-methyltransferase
MRLKNIPKAREVVASHNYVINNPEAYKNNWSKVFENTNPIHIEIGMGKGRFITQKALENPEINYIGIERYSSVLFKALMRLDNNLPDGVQICEENASFFYWSNLRFICMDAIEIGDIFGKGEVFKIYLNFSDPWPKSRHSKRRLTSAGFLSRYQQILDESGKLEFKTDNVDLFDFSLLQIREAGWQLEVETKDLHQDGHLCRNNVMTEYEEKFSREGTKICKLICSPGRETIKHLCKCFK